MTVSAPETISLFPLSNVVLFPMISAPLYIFEPRYRQMIQDALGGDRRIGMATVRPEHADRMMGDPAVFEVGCAGTISRAEQRPDGTWNLLLTATGRFRIVEEPPRSGGRLYRSALVELLDEPAGDPSLLRVRRDEIRRRLQELLARVGDAASPPPPIERLDGLDDRRFVNVLAQAIDFGTLEKQRLLEASGHLERATILRDLLDFRLAEIGAESTRGSHSIH